MMIYVDDVILMSPDHDSHLEYLEIVFSKLREANLKLQPAKCALMLPELRYLGFVFSAGNVRTDPKKTAVIKNYPQPTCTKDVRSFIGLTNFFRMNVRSYSDKAHGLIKLLRKKRSIFLGP